MPPSPNSIRNPEFEGQKGKIPENLRNTKVIGSSFGNLWKFNEIQSYFNTSEDWLEVKRKSDNIGPGLWRVHDKLYDLRQFIDKHPGGSDWIRVTEGSDITEAFETSHVININKVEAILAKYYVGDANHPRNSPYLFTENGFYKTLKRKVEPIMKKEGTGPTVSMIFMQDSMAVSYLILALIGAWSGSLLLQIIAGIALGTTTVGAHNFLHIKDNWRKYYFDLSPLSSFDFRITHGLSHHLFTNTIFDYEVSALQPFLMFLPSEAKNSFQRYGAMIYSHILYPFVMGQELMKRSISFLAGNIKLRPEDSLIFIQLLIFMAVSPSLISGFMCWIIIISAASYYLGVIGFNAAHHHPACFHDGDEPRTEPDFGLCQLDATLDKAGELHKSQLIVLATFGEHPLHHLFPTVCHSKLPLIKPIFKETLSEFLENNRSISPLELFVGTTTQFARNQPLSHQNQRNYQFWSENHGKTS